MRSASGKNCSARGGRSRLSRSSPPAVRDEGSLDSRGTRGRRGRRGAREGRRPGRVPEAVAVAVGEPGGARLTRRTHGARREGIGAKPCRGVARTGDVTAIDRRADHRIAEPGVDRPSVPVSLEVDGQRAPTVGRQRERQRRRRRRVDGRGHGNAHPRRRGRRRHLCARPGGRRSRESDGSGRESRDLKDRGLTGHDVEAVGDRSCRVRGRYLDASHAGRDACDGERSDADELGVLLGRRPLPIPRPRTRRSPLR